MSYSDIEHFSNMVSGCESLQLGTTKEPNAVYAFTVLKLHAGDAGLVAGQEGFLDNIKKGASNTVKWVKQLMVAIGNWVKNTFLKLIGKGSKNKVEVSKEIASELLVPSLERSLEKLKDIKEFEVNSVINDLEKYITAAKKGGDLSSYNEKVVNGIRSITGEVEKKVSSLKEGNEENNREASKLGTDLKKLADAGMAIYMGTNKAMSGVEWEPGKSLVDAVGVSRSRARSALMAEIDDHRLSIDEIKKSIKYVEDKIPDLYDTYEENSFTTKINTNKDSWSKDDLLTATTSTNANFSKERLNNIVSILKHLRDKGVKGFEKVG